MTSAPNPFAPPKTDAYDPTQAGSGEDVWRSDKLMIWRVGAALPNRCLKCNAPATVRLKRTLQWHHPAYFLFLLINVLVFLIVSLIVRKTAKTELPLCAAHDQRRKIGIGLVLGSFLLLFGGIALGSAGEMEVMIFVGLLLFLAALIAGIVMMAVVTPTKIDATYIRAKGVCAEYLARLPVFPGPP